MAHEEKVIEYLTREIETQTANLMTFRQRINFAVFIGPFVLLGATLYGKGIPRVHLGAMNRLALALLVISFVGIILSYLTMGIACAYIERHMWNQCNKWRDRIAQISRGHNTGFTLKELNFHEYLKYGYLWVYGAMIVAFVCATTLVLILQAHP